MSVNQRLRSVINMAGDERLIITPDVFQWLIKHPEGIVVGDREAELLLREVMKMPRDRTRSFSASSLGKCPRAHQFQVLGVPAQMTLDAWLQNKFNDGTWRHLRWQMMLLIAGIIDEIEIPVFHQEYNLRATLDGKGKHDTHGIFGFELKGVGSLSFLKKQNGPYPHHIKQIHGYFLAMPELEKFSLVYEDKMTQEWKEFVIERDPKVLRELRKELMRLNRAQDQKKLLPVLEECRNGKGQTYRQCPFSGHCLSATWETSQPSEFD